MKTVKNFFFASLLGTFGLFYSFALYAQDPGEPGWQPPAAEIPQDGKLRIIVFGAHPDDAEIQAGGTGALWAAEGHHVKLVAMTNGDIGHSRMAGGPLAQRRIEESKEAAKILGVHSEVLDIHDGELMPTLENRKKVVRLIRTWKADVVISHRPNDYHPDHRNTGLLVQDAAYMVTVPFFCPDTPYLERNPVFLFSEDRFQRPNPFRADIVIDIGPVIEKKIDALAAMESQFLEGGCCSDRPIPETPAEREAGRKRVRERFRERFRQIADRHRERITARYGEERARGITYAEAFEICEYGSQPDEERLRELFPF